MQNKLGNKKNLKSNPQFPINQQVTDQHTSRITTNYRNNSRQVSRRHKNTLSLIPKSIMATLNVPNHITDNAGIIPCSTIPEFSIWTYFKKITNLFPPLTNHLN